MGRRQTGKSTKITTSSGNVFTDLGLRDPAERKLKVQLAVTLNRILQREQLSQVQAANRLGVSQPKVSALKHYKLEGFSVERLIGFLTALSFDVEITVRPNSRPHGRVTVSHA